MSAGTQTSVIVLGSGFVGSAVRDALENPERSGSGGGAHDQQTPPVKVIAMGTSSHPPLARRDGEGIELLRSTIADNDVRAVINTAGRLRGSDEEMHAANVAWPTWLAQEALAGTGVRFVHLGSASEYGDPGSAEPVPETAPVNPSGTYGETKWAGSSAVLAARDGGLDAVVARGFNLVGPNLSPVSPLHQFLTDVTSLGPHGGVVEVWYPPTVRDFVLTADLARALRCLALVDSVPDIVNVCSQTAVTFEQIVTALADRYGVPVTIRSLDRPGIPAVVGDNTRLRQLCGFTPRMSPQIIAENARL